MVLLKEQYSAWATPLATVFSEQKPLFHNLQGKPYLAGIYKVGNVFI
jgi:hypothetical protein